MELMDSRWEKVEPRFFAKRETSLNRNGAEQRRLCPVLSPSAIALPVAHTYDLALRVPSTTVVEFTVRLTHDRSRQSADSSNSGTTAVRALPHRTLVMTHISCSASVFSKASDSFFTISTNHLSLLSLLLWKNLLFEN